ncbi:MAG: hypothetical protein HC839_02000 [Leptolyngbyaceae cyanobacterium RM2_2_21]|nr:hypothetical protein [Leptolyngbyaceae cyanobacterium RM2_2_21]NJN01607.1 hypothetical protein [Leptolyngbyaceae cyanobacterium RM1_1_2]
MTLLEILLLLAIAAVCGGLGQSLVGYSAGGCLASMLVGIMGAYLGLWIARELSLPVLLPVNIGGNTFPIIWSVIGSALLAALFGLLSRSFRSR